MSVSGIPKAYQPLFSKLIERDRLLATPRHLAHYTSTQNLENIVKNEEIWFGNPLFMNDFSEVLYGIDKGAQTIRDNTALASFLGKSLHDDFLRAFDAYIEMFKRNHLFDTYIFCLCEHESDDSDGLLSMWRAYGNDGNGAAIVFDTAKLKLVDSPLIISKVSYKNSDERHSLFQATAEDLLSILKSITLNKAEMETAARVTLEKLKWEAVFTKHHGFKEENEWRIVYLPDVDEHRVLSRYLGYHNGSSGIQPKLKFKVVPLDGVTDPMITFDNLVVKILLGPTSSAPLAVRSTQRMLEIIGKPWLGMRVSGSQIPYRRV